MELDFEVEWYIKLIIEVNFMTSFIMKKMFEISILLGYNVMSFSLDLWMLKIKKVLFVQKNRHRY